MTDEPRGLAAHPLVSALIGGFITGAISLGTTFWQTTSQNETALKTTKMQNENALAAQGLQNDSALKVMQTQIESASMQMKAQSESALEQVRLQNASAIHQVKLQNDLAEAQMRLGRKLDTIRAYSAACWRTVYVNDRAAGLLQSVLSGVRGGGGTVADEILSRQVEALIADEEQAVTLPPLPDGAELEVGRF